MDQAPPHPEEDDRVFLPPPTTAPARLVETQEALRAVCAQVAACDLVALDTESNSMHAYRERTCIVQVSAAEQSAIVDALAVPDLSPLASALDRDDVEVVFHGGDYDISVLTRDHDFRFARVFDTMIAATMLGEPKVGLADLVRTHFGVSLDKRFQRIDWARRPLTGAQLDYLQRDTLYLPGLRAHLAERLARADIVEEAEIEFRRLAARQGKPSEFDPDGWQRLKGASGLDDAGRAVLRALYLWREEVAQRRDLPPFKVLGPRTIVALAADPPRAAKRPEDLPHLGERERRRHGRAVLAALRSGLDAARRKQAPAGRRPPRLRGEDARAARLQRRRSDRLRDWRRGEAARRGVPNMVVLPNPALEWLASECPRDLDELDRCADLGPKRKRLYGVRLLALLDGSQGGNERSG